MAAVQMNVRIDADLKKGGDDAFGSIGYSPTGAVRELWGFARRNRHDPAAMREMMLSLRDPREVAAENNGTQVIREEQREWLERGPNEVRRICNEYGIDLRTLPSVSTDDYDEIIGMALDEDDGRIQAGR